MKLTWVLTSIMADAPTGARFEIPQVWVRFLLALVGLILAFSAALFSTVARESGSLWATLVFSSLALTLAAVVGLTTVPYLACRVAGGRVQQYGNRTSRRQ